MKIVINNSTYEAIDSLSFAPEADLINNSLPIPEFECRIFTNNYIGYGQWAELKDDLNNLFARYWIRFAERIGRDDDRQTYIVRIIAQSPLAMLEQVHMPAEMVDDDAWVLIMDILDYLGAMGQDGDIISSNDIDDAVGDIHIEGFVPEQSARERLLWLLSAAGGYARSCFYDVIEVKPVPLGSNAQKTIIPIDKTFWKPTISYRDYVTKIKVTGYEYIEGEPTSTDEYVTDGETYWIQSKQVITVTNQNVPQDAPNNEIIIDSLTVLTPTRASALATILANHYFNRMEVDADVINNAAYEPGDAVIVYTDEDAMVSGYIDKMSFSFGLQSRSSIHLIGTANIEVATLTIAYYWGNYIISTKKYTLPKGNAYSVTTEHFDKQLNNHRYVFRPTTATITGTLSSDTIKTVTLEVALDYHIGESELASQYKHQQEQLLDWRRMKYEEDQMALRKKYKGKSKQKKLQTALKKLSNAYEKDVHKARSAFDKMLQTANTKDALLYIYSVDEVVEESEVVEEFGTVVIS